MSRRILVWVLVAKGFKPILPWANETMAEGYQ